MEEEREKLPEDVLRDQILQQLLRTPPQEHKDIPKKRPKTKTTPDKPIGK